MAGAAVTGAPLLAQVAICNECTLAEHKAPEHECERASEAGSKQKEELQALLAESRGRVETFEESLEQLQNGLTDLQQQRDTAKTTIQVGPLVGHGTRVCCYSLKSLAGKFFAWQH